MKKLAKISGQLGFGKLIETILGIIRVKVSAVYLGTDGMGIVSQISTLMSFLRKITELGIGGGVTKYVAEYNGEKNYKKLKGVYTTSITGFGITGLVVILSCTVFSEKLALILLGDEQYKIYIIIAGIAVALQTQYQVIQRTLQGLLKIKETVILSVFSSSLGVLVTVPLIIFFDVTGAVVSFLALSAISLLAGHFYLKKIIVGIEGLKLSFGKIEKSHLINLLKFGGANSTVFISNMLSLLAIRSIVINEIGVDSNGLYQVAIGVSSSFISIVATSIWQYGMPKVATMLGDVKEIQKLQNDALRLILLVLVPIIVLLLVSREIWIPVLYSSAFLPAYGLIGWQLVGEIFRSIKWAPNIVNQPYERYRFIMYQAIAHGVLHLGIFFILYKDMGIVAAPFAYAISQGIMIPIVLGVHYYYDKFLFNKSNWVMLLSSGLILSITLYLFSDSETLMIEYYVFVVFLLLVWIIGATKKNEREKIAYLIKKQFKG